jgi:UDP-N-acetylglucosamine 2-epimerase (non-hydrolysing)
MSRLNLACIVGARPNFMKMAPLLRALAPFEHVRATLIHTGQHYDANLSDVFFDQLDMKRPDVCLQVGSGTHGQQTARILEGLESVFEHGPPEGGSFDRVVVVGDVNSTMAAALAAVKLQIPVAHVEAGLRSFDRSMPEEINRIVTDSVSDMLFVSEPAGMENLLREGHPEEHLFLVGNVMIDTLRRMLPMAEARGTLAEVGVQRREYGLVTLHRPANVDAPETLASLMDVLVELSEALPLLFPVHPRTRARLERCQLWERFGRGGGIRLLEPLGYLDFLALSSQARLLVTDSGGVQEESTVLGVPCLTLRPNTERPITVEEGTSTLIGADWDRLRDVFRRVIQGDYKLGRVPPLWDGRAAERVAAVLAEGSTTSVAEAMME